MAGMRETTVSITKRVPYVDDVYSAACIIANYFGYDVARGCTGAKFRTAYNTDDDAVPNEAELLTTEAVRALGAYFKITAIYQAANTSERDLIRVGKKIQAIKAIRERTGLGLKEAKDIADAVVV